jgi:hypothetical protein
MDPSLKREVFRMVICIILVICILTLAMVLAGISARAAFVRGGALTRMTRKRVTLPKPAHVVVDTLNLVHWMHATSKTPVQISTPLIVQTIAQTAASIRKKYPDRIMYVVKDRESVLNDPATRKAYADAARDNSVFIYAVERYEEPLRTARGNSHSKQGRDDFYAALLAKQYRCTVLTEDKFRDFDQFRQDVDPFHVYIYSFFKDLPDKDYVNPQSGAYRTLRKPRTTQYLEVLERPEN